MRARNVSQDATVAFVAIAAAFSLPAAAQDEGGSDDDDVLRIGWSQDAKTLNPFVGVNEEEFTIWALNWELLLNFDPETSSRARASRRAGRSRRTARP